MKISLEQAGKKFYRYWIFKKVVYTFSSPHSYAILGANGSGKSTFMRLLAGIHTPSSGKIHFENNGTTIPEDKLFPLISYCAPGMDIIEEMTLLEFLKFHFKHKKSLLPIEEIITLTGLGNAADKMMSDYSSGMKQRVKLAQAIFADTPLLLLDEPCTNLDEAGVTQYRTWMEQFANNRLVIVASNDEREYAFCKERIEMKDWK
jgi:ABC-type multidrug transport system ATPase subunit